MTLFAVNAKRSTRSSACPAASSLLAESRPGTKAVWRRSVRLTKKSLASLIAILPGPFCHTSANRRNSRHPDPECEWLSVGEASDRFAKTYGAYGEQRRTLR